MLQKEKGMPTIRINGMIRTIPEKIQAIKLVREVTNMGLKEAKDLLENLPTTFEVSSSFEIEQIVYRLRNYGYGVAINNKHTQNITDTEQAFKMFLIALINDGEYDQVVTFIKTKKHGSVAGAPTRNLEPM
jgi:hypothetical protein